MRGLFDRAECDTAIVYDVADSAKAIASQLSTRLPSLSFKTAGEINAGSRDPANVRPRAECLWCDRLLQEAVVALAMRSMAGLGDALWTHHPTTERSLQCLATCSAGVHVQQDVSRFVDPIQFAWSPESAEIEDLVREYSQSIYGDY